MPCQAGSNEGQLASFSEISTGSIGHSIASYASVFSRDDRLVARGSNDGSSRVWDVASGTFVKKFRPGSSLRSGAVKADGITGDELLKFISQDETMRPDGTVDMIDEVKTALDAYATSGLIAGQFDESVGGMQLPTTVARAAMAWFQAANAGTAAYPFLTIANANLIAAANPAARVLGVDFNPSHIANARALALCAQDENGVTKLLHVEVGGLHPLIKGRRMRDFGLLVGEKPSVLDLAREGRLNRFPSGVRTFLVTRHHGANQQPATAALHARLIPPAVALMKPDESLRIRLALVGQRRELIIDQHSPVFAIGHADVTARTEQHDGFTPGIDGGFQRFQEALSVRVFADEFPLTAHHTINAGRQPCASACLRKSRSTNTGSAWCRRCTGR